MILMDGKKIAQRKFSEIEKKIKGSGVSPFLGVVQIGENKVSEVYINEKRKRMESAGVVFCLHHIKEDVTSEEVKEKILALKEDGVIVQLPLPEGLKKREILDAIPLKKDVDILSKKACGRFYTGFFEILPPVVGAVDTFLKEYEIEVEGKNVVLIGAGELVGKPLCIYFMQREATVSVLNAKTKNLKQFTEKADIIVSGAGVPGLIKGGMVKKGAALIDAGTSVDEGKLKGDIEKETVEGKASFLSPVPGGVGPLTTYHLTYNLLYLKKQNGD